MEPFCVSLKRTLPPLHPLNQILKYHCREVIVPNTFGTPILIGETGFTAVLFAYGSQGALRLLQDIHPLTTWEVTDYRKNIKVRWDALFEQFQVRLCIAIVILFHYLFHEFFYEYEPGKRDSISTPGRRETLNQSINQSVNHFTLP